MSRSPERRPGLALIAGLVGVPSLLLATAAAPSPAGVDDAHADGLEVNLRAELGGEELLAIHESLASTQAGPTAGTDSDTVIPVEIPELLTADVISSSSTVGDDVNEAEAEIIGLHLRLSDQATLVEASILSSDVTCPADGATTANADLVDLKLLEQNINLEAGDEPIKVDLPVELDIPEIATAHAHVTAQQIEETTADTASATALEVRVALDLVMSDGTEVTELEVGRIAFAESHCSRATGTAGAGGDDGATTDEDDTTAPGDDDEDGSPLPALPGDEDDDGAGDDDEGDGTGLPGADDLDADSPSADSLNPDSGPAGGGTEVTVDGQNLDEATEVSIGGQTVEFTVDDEGTELYFTTPGGPAGTVDVVISFGDDDSDTLEFTYEEDGSESDVLAEGAEDDGAAGDGAAGDGGDGFGGESQAGTLAATGSDALPVTIALSMLLFAAGAWLLSQRTRTGTDTV
jgi:hypothetical protein